MSLYRKYRPQTFAHLVGQNHINQTLNNALKLERVNHAYLFTGPRGTGKTSTARLMAKAINCTDLQGTEPCNKCEICSDINEGKLIDLIEIDAASNRGIDEIRDLREKINFAPTRAKSKIYIIDEVHMLTKEAFNALLKTLEEPPSHVFFILATTEVHKIPETILSRCQRFDFRRIEDDVLCERLKYIAKEENINADEQAIELIAHHAEGGLRDAIGLLEQLTTENELKYDHVCEILGVSGVASIEKLYEYLRNNDVSGAVREINDLYSQGFDLVFFNKRLLEFLRKELIKAVNNDNQEQTNWILELINCFQTAYEQARFATIPQLPLEMAVIKSTMKSAPILRADNIGEPAVKTEPLDQQKPAQQTEPERRHQSIAKVEETDQSPPEKNEPTPLSSEETAEKKSPDSSGGEISLEDIKKKWSDVEKKIETPVVKRSLHQCSPHRVSGNTLVLAFSNNFNMDKLMETAHRTEAEKAFSSVFDQYIKITGEIHKVAEEIKKKDEELESKVLDIFEGELV